MTPAGSPSQPLRADTGAGGTEVGLQREDQRDMVRMHVHVDHRSALLSGKHGVREARRHDYTDTKGVSLHSLVRLARFVAS